MNNYQFPYPPSGTSQAPFNQFQQIQQMFPQPQGSVYSIGAPLEIGNVPIGSTGLSVALCLNENLMYIKSFQGGNPVIMAYKIIPYAAADENKANITAETNPLATFEERLKRIEKALSTEPTGGKFDGLL